MSARLVPLNSSEPAAPVIELRRPVVLVGRHPECDARINSPQVSRRHCCVALASDRLLIRDLGSRHGIRVNGRPVEEFPLRLGDEIAIGPILYRLENDPLDEPPPTPIRPPPVAKPPIAAAEGDDDLDLPIRLDDNW